MPADGVVRVYTALRTVRFGGRDIQFTRVEFDLLHFLAAHPRQVFTRQQLLEGAWGHQHVGTRTVDVHIRRLRSKLGDDLITTIRGIGYRLTDDGSIRIARPHPATPPTYQRRSA